MKTLTWDDVKQWCYPGSPVDVGIWVPARGGRVAYSDCVIFAEVEDGETYLTTIHGAVVNARDYQAPLGWVPPKD